MVRTRSILRAGLGIALGCWMGISSTVVTLAADSVADEASRATAYAIQLQRSLQAIEDGRQQAPRDRWDPQYIVDTVGVDPAALYGWERQNVGWVPYRGQLRGPVGVLMDRRANSLDMSLLLAKLMSLAGLKARLAHATLSDDVVDGLWNDLAAAAAQAAAAPSSDADTAMLTTPAKLAPLAGRTDQSAVVVQAAAAGTPSGSLFGGAGEESGSLFGAPEEQDTAPQSPADVANLYELDPAKGTDTLTAASDVRDDLADELQRRVADQGARMLSMVGPAGDKQVAQEQARDRAALADHWWVQVEDNGNWTNYDLLAPGAAVDGTLAAPTETLEPNAIPQDARQRVEIKVVAEQLVGGQLKQNTLLAQDVDPSASIGQRITLRNMPLLWPADWDAITPDDVQEKLFAALYTQSEWMPMLSIGDEAYQQQSVRDTGEPNAEPQPQSNPFLSLAFPAAGKVGRITDLFGQLLDESAGLGGDETAAPAEAAPEDAPRAQGELTAEWLDFTTYVPGEAPRVERRALFDILGDSMRRSGDFSTFQVDQDARLKRAAGEMTTTEILVLPCWPASEYIADMTAGLALANKPVLDEFAKDPFGKAPPNSIELFSKMKGMAAPAYLYSVLRSQALQTNSSVFVDRPQIVAQHDILARVGPGELTSQAALDVVENGIGVDPFGGRDSFMVRVLQGIADTNAEALALPQGGDSVADAFATADGNWTALGPADRDRIAALGLPPDIETRLSAELDAGYVAVVPTNLQDAGKHGWWRVDPASGSTLGIGNLGWGQDLVEFAFQLMIQAMMAQIACMAYTAATAGVEAGIEKVTSGKNITGGSAEEGRKKIAEWTKNCVSQALVELTAGLSVSWIHSHFIDGARVPTWNDRAKTSSTPHGPTPLPNGGANGSHNTPPTEEGGNNGPHNTPPTNEGGNNGPHNTPPTEEGGNNGPHNTPPTEEGGNNGPHNTPPTEEGGNNGPRTTPPTEEGGDSGARKTTPPTEENDQLKPLPPDESLDGKTMLDPNCVAEAYEVRVAMLEVDPSPTRSDAQPAPLVAAGCPPSSGKQQPPAENEGPPTPQPESEAAPAKTPPADLATAQGQYNAALDAYRNDPSPANRAALTEALHGLDRAEAANPRPKPAPPPEPSAEYKAAKQTYDEALNAYRTDPSASNRANLDKALGDYNRAAYPPKQAPTGPVQPEGPPTPRPQAEPAAPPVSPPPGEEGPAPQPNKTQPIENAPPRPIAEQEGPPTPRPQDPALADTQAPRTEPMEGAPARPTAEPEGPPTPRPQDPALADTQVPRTEPMEGAPARPTPEGEPQGSPRSNTSNDDALADTQAAPRPGTSPDTIRQINDAERLAAAKADDAFTKWQKNPTPENNAALHQADAEHSAAIKAAGEAWGQATPEQRGEALGQYTAERQAAQEAFNEAIRARDANPTADTRQAAIDAQDAVNAARNTEMAAAGSAGAHIPDGTPPPMTPLPPVEPMARPEGPPTPRPQEPAEPAANPRPIAEQEGPPTPRPEDPALADTQAPRTEPMEGAPARPTGADKGALADTRLAETQNDVAPRTEPMPGAPPRPAGEPEATPQVRTGNDDPLAQTQLNQTQPMEGAPQRPTSQNIVDAANAHTDAADEFNAAQRLLEVNPTAEDQAKYDAAADKYFAAQKAEQEAWKNATQDERVRAQNDFAAQREEADNRLYDTKLQYDINPSADNKAAWDQAKIDSARARRSEMQAATETGLPIERTPNAPPGYKPIDQAPTPAATQEPEAQASPPPEAEGPPTPRQAEPAPAEPIASPNAKSIAIDNPRPLQQSAEPQPVAPPNQTQPMEGAPQRPTAQGIYDAVKNADASDTAYLEAGAAARAEGSPEALAKAEQAGLANADAISAERRAWQQATPEERLAAQKLFADDRLAAQQRLDAARAENNANSTEASQAALQQAARDYAKARDAEVRSSGSAGVDAEFLPSPVTGEPPPPSSGTPPPADGASPNAQSVVINNPRPVQANVEPQEIAPLQQPGPNQTQPMQGAPQRPPQTYEQRVVAIQSFTDAAVEANNAKAAAAQALMANDTYQTRLDYDRASYAEERARKTEAGRWYRVGGVGALPSQVSGRLQPMPEGLQDQIEANHPALAKTASADVTGGTNTTLAMGLGSLAGTIQRGP